MTERELLKEFIKQILMEELTDGEVSVLEPGNALIDPDLNLKTVVRVNRTGDEEGDEIVDSVDMISYDTPDEPGSGPITYKQRVTPDELADYEVS